MSVPNFSPQFQSRIRHLRHAGMLLKCLWAGMPCQRPVRSSLSPREDATEVLVGKVAVPKGAHSTVHRPVRHRFGAGLLRGDGSGIPVSKVAVPKGALAELIEL